MSIIGELLIKRLYNAVRNSPQWNQTLFIITFDEHGGFYDHVPPPMNVPNPDGLYATDPVLFRFDRLGVRVPTLMVSPWINKVIDKNYGSQFKYYYKAYKCILYIFY